ncbi:MAG: hypothetical protein WA347_03045 [Rhabdochlamydiaceae bacterium]
MNFREIIRLPAFEKDLKKLLKRFQSLEKDLEVFQKVQLILFHKQGLDNGGIVRIEGLGQEILPIFKARKFACRSLKGKGVQSGIRVIYAYCAEFDRIQYIEIYYKGDQEIETKSRLYDMVHLQVLEKSEF